MLFGAPENMKDNRVKWKMMWNKSCDIILIRACDLGTKHAHYCVVNDWVRKRNQNILCIFNKIWFKKDLHECNIIQYKLSIEQSLGIYAIEKFPLDLNIRLQIVFFHVYLDCNPDIWLKTNIEYQVFANKIKNSVIFTSCYFFLLFFYSAKSDFIL